MENTEKLFHCDKCDQDFKNVSGYKSHLKSKLHIEGEQPPKVKETYHCDGCDKDFKNISALKNHNKSKYHLAEIKPVTKKIKPKNDNQIEIQGGLLGRTK